MFHDPDGDSTHRRWLEAMFVLADELIEAGFDVLPAWVYPKDDGTLGKTPATRIGHLEAHRDRQVIRQQLVNPPWTPAATGWPRQVVVGFVPGSGGCAVLDCDIKRGAVGQDTYKQLVADHGSSWVTAWWRSPSGGVNILVRCPPGHWSNSRPDGWTDIDLRITEGWVVAPGNTTPWGDWRWRKGGLGTISPLPDSMAAQLKPARAAHHRRATNAETVAFIEASPPNTSLAVTAAFAERLERLEAARRGNRHPEMVSTLAWAFGMEHLDLRDALDQIREVFDRITAGEGRHGEVDQFATWVTAQELDQRASRPPWTPGGHPSSAPVNLPDQFWAARPYLAALRAWAHDRGRSADAVYGAVRARIATLTPWQTTVDTTLATPMSLNAVVALLGPPGSGKTTAMALARHVVALGGRKDLFEGPLGSGEGLVEAYMGTVTIEDPGGKTRTEKAQTKHGGLFLLDEGEALLKMADRGGATVLTTIRQAWSGAVLGQMNASGDTWRLLGADTYRFVLLMGLQDSVAARFITESLPEGTPQRLVLFNATDPAIDGTVTGGNPPEPPWPHWNIPYMGQPVELAAPVRDAIRTHDLAVQRGDVALDPLDAHRVQNQAKEAAAIMIADGRLDRISEDDWALAGLVMDTSDALRARVLEAAEAARRAADRARDEAQLGRRRREATVLSGDRHDQAVERGARRMGKVAPTEGSAEPVLWRQLQRCVASRDRKEATTEEMREFAEMNDWIKKLGDGWVRGGSTPT